MHQAIPNSLSVSSMKFHSSQMCSTVTSNARQHSRRPHDSNLGYLLSRQSSQLQSHHTRRFFSPSLCQGITQQRLHSEVQSRRKKHGFFREIGKVNKASKRAFIRTQIPLDFSQHAGTLSATARAIGVRKEDLSNYVRRRPDKVGARRRRLIRSWLIKNGYIAANQRPRHRCPDCGKEHAIKRVTQPKPESQP